MPDFSSLDIKRRYLSIYTAQIIKMYGIIRHHDGYVSQDEMLSQATIHKHSKVSWLCIP